MIHLCEKTWQLPDTGMTLRLPPVNVLQYLYTPTTTTTYEHDDCRCTASLSTNTTAINHYDYANSLMDTGKSSVTYYYDDLSNTSTYAEMNMHYYGYRYYSPELGRWVSRDPIQEVGGMNVYGFVLNLPPDIVDRDGRHWLSKAVNRLIKIIAGPRVPVIPSLPPIPGYTLSTGLGEVFHADCERRRERDILTHERCLRELICEYICDVAIRVNDTLAYNYTMKDAWVYQYKIKYSVAVEAPTCRKKVEFSGVSGRSNSLPDNDATVWETENAGISFPSLALDSE